MMNNRSSVTSRVGTEQQQCDSSSCDEKRVPTTSRHPPGARNNNISYRRRTFMFVIAGPFPFFLWWFLFFMRYGPVQNFHGIERLPLRGASESLLRDSSSIIATDDHQQSSESIHQQNAAGEESSNNKNSLRRTVTKPGDSLEEKQSPKADATANNQKKWENQRQQQQNESPAAVSQPDVPNLLIVGAQKSGTTAVQSWIDLHSNVCKAASVPDGKPLKEVHFFNNDSLFTKGANYYRQHFQHCTKKTSIVMDTTPDYLPQAARVRETYNKYGGTYAKDLKILMILREPVAREYSWFNHIVLDAKKPNPPRYAKRVLDDERKYVKPFVNYLEKSVFPEIDSSFGQYAKWLRLWMEHFDRKQILVLSYDELMNNPVSVIGRLRKFLGFKEGDARDEIDVHNKRSGKVESPPLYCKVQARLNGSFAKANKDLYDLLDKHPGPDMEQRPFPKFKLSSCTPDDKATNGQSETK